MATQPSDPDIPHLLAELQSSDFAIRLEAVNSLAAAKLDTPEVVNALKAAADKDDSRYVREAALQALKALGPSVGDLKVYTAPPAIGKAQKPLTRNEKIKEFAIGFVGWNLVTGLLRLIRGLAPPILFIFALWLTILLPLVNLIVLIVLAFFRRGRWVGLGMLSAYALNALVLTLWMGGTFSDYDPVWLYMAYCSVPFWSNFFPDVWAGFTY